MPKFNSQTKFNTQCSIKSSPTEVSLLNFGILFLVILERARRAKR